MKKFIFLTMVLTISTLSIQAQVDSAIKYPCYVQELDMGTYSDKYSELTEKDFNKIETRLNKLLSIKDIQVLRKTGFTLNCWFTLMRIRDIKWVNRKTDILVFVNSFLKQILENNSFLNAKNKNILYDLEGCPYTAGDPLTFPYACYWVTMEIDAKFATNMLDETWGLISNNEPFSNDLRGALINLLSNYYNDSNVQSFLKKLEKTKLLNNESLRIQEIKFNYELKKSKSQFEAWEKLTSLNKTKLSHELSIENKSVWEKDIRRFEGIFGYNLEVKPAVELAEQEKDTSTKYWLAYLACYIENGNFPKKSDNALIKRIHKLVSDVQNEAKDIKQNYLNDAYKIFKEWH